MSNSTSNILGKLGRSVSTVNKAQDETDDAPQLAPSSSPKPSKDLDMQNMLTNALGLSSSKKHTPMD